MECSVELTSATSTTSIVTLRRPITLSPHHARHRIVCGAPGAPGVPTFGDFKLGHQGREFADLIRRHCERVPSLGWASITQTTSDDANQLWEKAAASLGDDETKPSTTASKPKTVLILMSDTGGGHRASAEAIKATFELEYGDKYKVCGKNDSLCWD